MKYIGLLLSSVIVFIIVLSNLYYNSITLDMKNMKDYIAESNIILSDVIEKEDRVKENKDEYIRRIINIKKGLKNCKTSFLLNTYKEYKLKSLDNLIYSILESVDNKIYLTKVQKYDKLGEEELDRLINKNIIEVTYLSIKTYI